MVPSKFDYDLIDGVLGDFNGDSSDDFTVNGVNYKKNLTQFFDLFK